MIAGICFIIFPSLFFSPCVHVQLVDDAERFACRGLDGPRVPETKGIGIEQRSLNEEYIWWSTETPSPPFSWKDAIYTNHKIPTTD